MNSQLIIYTRNRDVDYRMAITPDENLCPPDTRKYFRKLIRGAIDVDTYDDPLNAPRWLYAKKGNAILFGVATMLEQFNTECCTDFAGRKVRGFYGIVIDASRGHIALPYDLNFFDTLNKRFIEPYWDATNESFARKNIEIDLNGYDVELLPAGEEILQLNTDSHICLILGDVEIKDALQSALANKDDLSLVCGFNTKQHAFASEADYNYMNAIVNDIHDREAHRNKEKAIAAQPDYPAVPPPIPPRPKKAFRPKIIISLLVVTLVCIAILLLRNCIATPTSQNSSTSGEPDRMSVSDTIQKKI